MLTKKYIQKELALRIKGIRPNVTTNTDVLIGELKSALMMVDCLPDDEPDKKYNEAMLRADEAVQKGCLDKDMFDIIFPPEESEDERIRAVILKLVLGMRDEIFTTADKLVTKPKVLAWLEKHKESLHIPETCKENPDSFTDEHPNIIYTEMGEEFAKQKEQKPNYCHYGGDPNIERCKYCSAACIGRLTEEQKPVEWSDEDEEMRNLLVAILEVNHPDGFFKANEIGTTDMRGFHTEEIISWLKSLRPKWKPSEEQMEALRNAFHKLANTDVADSVRLSIMYDNLKKL